VRFFPPPEPLGGCFTTFYLVEIDGPPEARITDHLHPEWAGLRFHSGERPVAEGLDGQRLSGTDFAVTGPSSKAVRFTIGPTRMWGVGMLPLGWAQFVPAPADQFADALVDGNTDPVFAAFRPLAEGLFGEEPDLPAELARLRAFFLERASRPVADRDRIFALHKALVDPEIRNVAGLVASTGISQRTLERLCQRAFGFPPKLLLRRQRFMRSLAQFMLDPSLKWIGAIDGHYHDQAQFVRDFHQFMGMSPRQYAALPKPVLDTMMRERERFAGTAVQTLDGPGGVGSGRFPAAD
jgi:AraC-like DNA-binding protein